MDDGCVGVGDVGVMVASSNPGRSGGRIFFSSQLCVLILYSVSVPTPCYLSGMLKTPVILPKVQVAGYTETRIHSKPNEVRMG